MKIIIFGAGKFYQEKKKMIPESIEIVAFLDNDVKKQGTYQDGIPIISPDALGRYSYDKIILMSMYEDAMKTQLLELGIERKNIWYWKRFISETTHGIFKLYGCSNSVARECGKRILIISTDLGYNGGTIAAVYAAAALQNRGNMIILAAPGGDERFIKEITESGVNIVICPALPYLYPEELFWIRQFDAVLVNVFQMAVCACEISRVKPVMWWVHEYKEIYEKTLEQFREEIDFEQFEKINIYAVSPIAQRNFNSYFPNGIKKVLHYGIPDQKENAVSGEKKDSLIFAVIGAVCPIKGQDIFIKSVQLLHEEEKKNVQFWLIGNLGNDPYSKEVSRLVKQDKAVKVIGKLSRGEMHEWYQKIDVAVCPSLEDSMPIVVTEGMMYEKTCIVSDAVGTARYINHGENGLIFKNADVSDLCEKIRWAIQNRERLHAIGRKARQIYETYFTMECFGKKLEEAIQDTIGKQ